MFLRDYVGAMQGDRLDDKTPAEHAQTVFGKHGAVYKELGKRQRLEYEKEA